MEQRLSLVRLGRLVRLVMLVMLVRLGVADAAAVGWVAVASTSLHT